MILEQKPQNSQTDVLQQSSSKNLMTVLREKVKGSIVRWQDDGLFTVNTSHLDFVGWSLYKTKGMDKTITILHGDRPNAHTPPKFSYCYWGHTHTHKLSTNYQLLLYCTLSLAFIHTFL